MQTTQHETPRSLWSLISHSGLLFNPLSMRPRSRTPSRLTLHTRSMLTLTLHWAPRCHMLVLRLLPVASTSLLAHPPTSVEATSLSGSAHTQRVRLCTVDTTSLSGFITVTESRGTIGCCWLMCLGMPTPAAALSGKSLQCSAVRACGVL